MAMPKRHEGKYTSYVEVEGVVGRNTAAVQVVFQEDGTEPDFKAVGSSKRANGDVYDANVGANLALADALEQIAYQLRARVGEA